MRKSRSCTFFEMFKWTHPRSTDGADNEALTKIACSKSEIEVDSADCEDSNKFLKFRRLLSCCTDAIRQTNRLGNTAA